MKINNISVAGGDKKLLDFLSKGGLKVSDADKSLSEKFVGTDLILENLSGELDVRRTFFKKCDENVPPHTIFATTAECGITDLAAGTRRSDKFVGLNFSPMMRGEGYIVQITRGLETSADTVQACIAFINKIGAVSVQVKETSGLILNRVMAATINQATIMYDTGLVTAAVIDRAIKVCGGWPIGPFELADTIGIDKIVSTLEMLSQQIGPQYIPNILLRKMVAAGHLGKKTGKGFYTYPQASSL
ncbi:MAG: 3-hydroxyacyl-CoA dehydrogenase family protein [Smithellaceae bacterium]